jgi:hypothetical protein
LKTSPIAPPSNGSSDNSILVIWCSMNMAANQVRSHFIANWTNLEYMIEAAYPSFQRELFYKSYFFAYWCFWDTSNPLFKAFQEFDRKVKAKSWFTATSCFMSLVVCELKSTRWQCLVVETWM